MKKLFAFFIVFMSVMPVFAEGEGEVVEPSNKIASTSYVDGAYAAAIAITDALNSRVTTLEDNGTGGASLTQDSLNVTGTGPFLSSIGIGDGGVINVTKRDVIQQNPEGKIVTSVSTDEDGNIIVSRGNINQIGDGPIVTSVSATTDGNIDVTTGGINVAEDGDGSVVTSVAWNEDEGKLSVTKGNVQIPVGDTENPTEFANIWIQ